MPVELWPVMRHRMDSYRTQRHKWWGSEVSEELVANLMAEIAGPRRLHRPRPRRRAAARQGALGLELVGDPARPRLPLHGRRGGDRRAQQPVRDQVRPPRAGAARRRARRADADARGGQPRARTPRRAVARRGHGALPGRLLPHAAAADRRRPGGDGRDRGPRRRGRARAGADRGLEPAGVPPPRRPPAAPRRRAGPAEPVRPRGVAARAHREALRLPLPHRDLHAGAQAASTATTCCRSCSARRSSAGSTSRPTGSPVASWSRRRTPSPERSWAPVETAEELSAELVRLAGWLGMDELTVEPRGDLAPLLRF